MGDRVSGRLLSIDPCTHLAGALQQISEHAASRVADLTPRLWQRHLAAGPLRSDIHDFPV